MKFDLHTHHDRCGHAQDGIEKYIQSAITKGLDIIGISDHTPFFESQEDHVLPGVSMAKSEFPHYVNEVLELKDKYRSKIDVLLGVEADFFPQHIDLYKRILQQYPFDYIIGSVHISNGVDIFNEKRWEGLSKQEKREEKEIYYRLIQQSARSKTFDILGHIDAMKSYYPAFSQIQTEVLDHTLQIIAEQDVAIEVNTSGKTKKCGGWYPADEILERSYFLWNQSHLWIRRSCT